MPHLKFITYNAISEYFELKENYKILGGNYDNI